MKKEFLIFGIILMLVVSVLASVFVKKSCLMNNNDAIKSLSDYCAMMVAVAVALTGFTFVAAKGSGIKAGRMSRASKACIFLVILGMIGFILTILSLQYHMFRPYAFGSACTVTVGMIQLVIGIGKEIAEKNE